MKAKNENSPVLIYRDEQHQQKIRLELEISRKALQAVLDVWNGLELTPCNDIHSLIMNPQKVYSEAVNELAVVPVTAGRFQVSKQAFIQTLDVPLPDSLYRAAKTARQHTFCAVPGLWIIEENRIVLNESEALTYTDALSVYASGESLKYGEMLNRFLTLFNELNDWQNGELLQPISMAHALFNGKFEIRETGNNRYELRINPETLKKWLRV